MKSPKATSSLRASRHTKEKRRAETRKACLGLDLSLTSTGAVIWNGRRVLAAVRIATNPAMGDDETRIDHISRSIISIVKKHRPAVAVIENYAYNRPFQMARLGELGGVVKYRLRRTGVIVHTVPNSTSKKFLTDNGKASKQQMVTAARAYFEVDSDDIAEAFGLAKFGVEHYITIQPVEIRGDSLAD